MYCSDVDWTELVQDLVQWWAVRVAVYINMYFKLHCYGVYVLHVTHSLPCLP